VQEAGLTMADIAAVGFHGQTVLHRAPATGRKGRTRQLGDGALMAQLVGASVVHDFRNADMAAGGQGAPLSAVYHAALLDILGEPGTAILNLGGVANVTARDGQGGLVAFDTPPPNGIAVSAGFAFDVPVRFDTDTLDVTLDVERLGSITSIPLLEIRR